MLTTSLPNYTRQGCLPTELTLDQRWQLRTRMAQAMALLCVAWLLIWLLPFRLWRDRLGLSSGRSDPAQARHLARHIERAVQRLPFHAKCLPQAMTLSWLLRAARVAHTIKLAARPAALRGGDDDLHAWVECGGHIVIGDLPGPWVVTLSLPVGPRNPLQTDDQ